MKNNLLTYLSILHEVSETQVDKFDEYLSEADDGEGRPAAEAKAEAVQSLQHSIDKLVELKKEFETTSLKKLRAIYDCE